MEKRLSYIDFAKALGIIMIVVGHFLPRGNTFKVIFYTFHVPLFAFISGLLTSYQPSFKACAKRLLKLTTRILIPYTIWHILSGICYVARDLRSWNDVFKSYFFLDGMTIWNDALWYAPSIFIVSISFTLICYAIRGSKIASLVLSCLSMSAFIIIVRLKVNITAFGYNNFLGIRNLLLLFSLLCLGYACKDLIKYIVSWDKNPYKSPVLYTCAIAFAFLIILADHYNHQNPISILYGDYNNIFVFSAFAVLLPFFFVISCALLPRSNIADLLSKNSLFIMCSHYFFLLWWAWDNGISAVAENTPILLSLAINTILLYIVFCASIQVLCRKLPICSRALGIFGIAY